MNRARRDEAYCEKRRRFAGGILRKIGTTACVLLALGAGSTASSADYGARFLQQYGVKASIAPAMTPARSDAEGLFERYSPVESKTNQPRNVVSGTNPHNGADLAMASGERVYAILPGKVTEVKSDTSSQLGSVIVDHDTDGDGAPNGVYVQYVHIDPAGSGGFGIRVGDYVTETTVIGTVDRAKRYNPHLHIQQVSRGRSGAKDAQTMPMYLFYRHASLETWNAGSDLDYVSADWQDGNMLYLTAYAGTDNPRTNRYDRNRPAEIQLHYKIGSSGQWKMSPVRFSLYDANTLRYRIDLQKATGARKGQKVYAYAAAIRAVDPTFPNSASYRHGLWPQFYKQPDRVLYASSSAKADAASRVFTIR
ncbi:M23 family metallopeptidase [Saccharibacillus alkalitolerans]|uniref:M23 family metallopeptidase n=1 Tax=Saccharibacillus alkalitolerans TaxID=2705290 RepID=A0ABX0FAE4_9BACL|nr:M23 family metallopeptidase [Saccharibacillus alkalitolerans]NGZ77014.1 M23 family metallopeptidase [Saccharibacillus alkalitolerans]